MDKRFHEAFVFVILIEKIFSLLYDMYIFMDTTFSHRKQKSEPFDGQLSRREIVS